MKDWIRNGLAITAVMLVIAYWLTSAMPLDKFEFTVIQMLAMLIIVIVLGERRRG